VVSNTQSVNACDACTVQYVSVTTLIPWQINDVHHSNACHKHGACAITLYATPQNVEFHFIVSAARVSFWSTDAARSSLPLIFIFLPVRCLNDLMLLYADMYFLWPLASLWWRSLWWWVIFVRYDFYPRDAMLARSLRQQRVCPSVCPSVTRRYCA